MINKTISQIATVPPTKKAITEYVKNKNIPTTNTIPIKADIYTLLTYNRLNIHPACSVVNKLSTCIRYGQFRAFLGIFYPLINCLSPKAAVSLCNESTVSVAQHLSNQKTHKGVYDLYANQISLGSSMSYQAKIYFRDIVSVLQRNTREVLRWGKICFFLLKQGVLYVVKKILISTVCQILIFYKYTLLLVSSIYLNFENIFSSYTQFFRRVSLSRILSSGLKFSSYFFDNIYYYILLNIQDFSRDVFLHSKVFLRDAIDNLPSSWPLFFACSLGGKPFGSVLLFLNLYTAYIPSLTNL